MSDVLCRARSSIKEGDGSWKAAGEELILPRAEAEALQARRFLVILDAEEAAPAPAPAAGPKSKPGSKGGAKPPAE